MEKQMPALVDFFFIQSFFDWVARVQKLLSKSISFMHSNSAKAKIHDSSSRIMVSCELNSKCKETVPLTESLGCSQRRPDNNRDEYDDIKLVMRRLGLVCEEESEDKRLVFDDISTLFDETEPCLAEVKVAFSVFDQNNDGFIDEYELKRVMSALGINGGMGLETCQKMIRDYDVNGDGLIDFSEFVKVVEKSFC